MPAIVLASLITVNLDQTCNSLNATNADAQTQKSPRHA